MKAVTLDEHFRDLAEPMSSSQSPPSYMQVTTRNPSADQTVRLDVPPYATVLMQKLEESTATMTHAMHDIKQEMHSNKEELMQGVNQAFMRAAHAEEMSVKTSSECRAECRELREHIAQQQHIIDAQDAQLRLWQMQSELDRPFRAEKMHTVYIAPTHTNTDKAPFSSEQLDYSQAKVTTKPNMRGGVEVQFANRDETDDMLKKFPNIKNTQMPYRASYAKTPLQQRRDRLYTAIKQRLPRGMTGYMVKGQLHITTGAMSLAKKGEAPSESYPSWLHAQITPAGMDVGDPINLENVPQYARQAIEYAEYKHKQKKGNNTDSTPMRTLTDGGADISDVEMADKFSRGRRSPTGETPGGKRNK